MWAEIPASPWTMIFSVFNVSLAKCHSGFARQEKFISFLCPHCSSFIYLREIVRWTLFFCYSVEHDEIRISFGRILFNDDENQEVEYTSNQSNRKKRIEKPTECKFSITKKYNLISHTNSFLLGTEIVFKQMKSLIDFLSDIQSKRNNAGKYSSKIYQWSPFEILIWFIFGTGIRQKSILLLIWCHWMSLESNIYF